MRTKASIHIIASVIGMQKACASIDFNRVASVVVTAADALVDELKKEQSPEIALKQIREKNYFECLKNYSGEVLLVGLNYTTDNDTGYKKHTCKIEKIIK